MAEYRAPRVWHIEPRFGRFYVVNQWGGFAMHWPTIEQAQSQLAEYVQQGDKALPSDGEEAECIRCGRRVIWEFDCDIEGNQSTQHGFWYDAERGTEACTPGPNDEDNYHEGKP